MKKVICILLFSLTISCVSYKKKLSEIPKGVNVLAKKFTDSLIMTGVDTILVYTQKCSQCSIYVFWKQKEVCMIKKFDNQSGVGNDKKIEDLTDYFFANKEEILNQVLRPPDYLIDHFHYTVIELFINRKQFYEKTISNYDLKFNEDKKLVIWIRKIEILISNFEQR